MGQTRMPLRIKFPCLLQGKVQAFACAAVSRLQLPHDFQLVISFSIAMHFEKSLKRATYAPWKDKYIDYQKLKGLLRDDGSDAGSAVGADDGEDWTERDEEAFVQELINVQLEKVHSFQADTVSKLREQTSSCEADLDPIVTLGKTDGEEAQKEVALDEDGKKRLRDVLQRLDGVTGEMNELEKYSRINYTGFLKAAKKHDRRRGQSYRVMPIMRVRLGELPFNKEDFSPLLFRLSTMYSFCRGRLGSQEKTRTFSEHSIGSSEFTSYKCRTSVTSVAHD